MISCRLLFRATLCFWFLCWCIGASQGLLCYTCWKLICDEEYEACYEIRHFPSVNSRNREISRPWRTGPECPADGNDLRWSKSYIQNCSEDESSCGTYLIQVTASISKNSINESEYPILVTPNYYHGTIVALGCIPLREKIIAVDNSSSISLDVPPYHVINDSRENVTEMHMAPHVIRNSTYEQPEDISGIGSSNGTTPSDANTNKELMTERSNADNTTASSTVSVESTAPTTTYSTIEDTSYNPVTIDNSNTETNPPPIEYTLSTPESELPSSGLQLLVPGSGTGSAPVIFNALRPRSAEPEPLPEALPIVGMETLEALIPIITYGWESLQDEICKVPLTHYESRESYGTLMRINMTGKFYICKSCSEDLCNMIIPTEADTKADNPEEDDENNTIEGSSSAVIITLNHQRVITLAATVITLTRAFL